MIGETQIQFLHKFCEQHYVRYYDVQVELVDHLAAAIEQEQEQDPGLDFTQAVNKVYKGFGITGFSKMVGAYERSARKRYNRKFYQIFKSYFTPPRIFFTLLLFLILLIPFYIVGVQHQTFLRLIILAYAFIFTLASLFHNRFFKKRHPEPKKTLLALNSGWPPDNSIFVIILTQSLFAIDKFWEPITYTHLTFFLTVGIYVLMGISYLAGIRAFVSIYNEAKENFKPAFQN